MPIPATDASLQRTLLRDGVYQRLRAAIVDGTLAPGEVLRDQELAGWLGVSRTPVREALLRLGQAGLVSATPGRSTRVTTLDARATRDAQAVVCAMHEVAVRAAVPQLTAEDLEAMRRANRRFAVALGEGDAQAALEADDELHGIPVRAAANDAVRAVLDQYTPLLRRVERLRFGSLEGRRSVALHDQLIDQCGSGDAEAAAATSTLTWQTLTPLLEAALSDRAEEGSP